MNEVLVELDRPYTGAGRRRKVSAIEHDDTTVEDIMNIPAKPFTGARVARRHCRPRKGDGLPDVACGLSSTVIDCQEKFTESKDDQGEVVDLQAVAKPSGV
jgi:hypothetical protein